MEGFHEDIHSVMDIWFLAELWALRDGPSVSEPCESTSKIILLIKPAESFTIVDVEVIS